MARIFFAKFFDAKSIGAWLMSFSVIVVVFWMGGPDFMMSAGAVVGLRMAVLCGCGLVITGATAGSATTGATASADETMSVVVAIATVVVGISIVVVTISAVDVAAGSCGEDWLPVAGKTIGVRIIGQLAPSKAGTACLVANQSMPSAL